MGKEKKELMKSFKAVIEDLLDNYEKYTDEEKAQIKEIFEKVAEIKKVLGWNIWLLAVNTLI